MKQKLLDALKPKHQKAEIKGVDVFVRGLTVGEYEDFIKSEDPDIAKRIICWCFGDDQGQPIFDMADFSGVGQDALSEMVNLVSAATAGRIDELKKS